MKAKPPHGTPIPHVRYSCTTDTCAEERSWPSNDLTWLPELGGFYCPDCIQQLPEPPDEGITLEEWIAEVEAVEKSKHNQDGPLATDLGIQHCGRKLFFVDGRTGVWCSHRDYGELGSERILAVVDNSRRGRARNKTLYHLDALSAQLRAAFLKQESEDGKTPADRDYQTMG